MNLFKKKLEHIQIIHKYTYAKLRRKMFILILVVIIWISRSYFCKYMKI